MGRVEPVRAPTRADHRARRAARARTADRPRWSPRRPGPARRRGARRARGWSPGRCRGCATAPRTASGCSPWTWPATPCPRPAPPGPPAGRPGDRGAPTTGRTGRAAAPDPGPTARRPADRATWTGCGRRTTGGTARRRRRAAGPGGPSSSSLRTVAAARTAGTRATHDATTVDGTARDRDHAGRRAAAAPGPADRDRRGRPGPGHAARRRGRGPPRPSPPSAPWTTSSPPRACSPSTRTCSASGRSCAPTRTSSPGWAGTTTSAGPEDDRGLDLASATTPRPYLRWDPVPAPAVVPRHELGTGEQPAHLVVRSGMAEAAGPGLAPTDGRAAAERHLAPPKATQLEAETAGRFDAAIGTGDAAAIRRLYAGGAGGARDAARPGRPQPASTPATGDPQPGIALVDRPGRRHRLGAPRDPGRDRRRAGPADRGGPVRRPRHRRPAPAVPARPVREPGCRWCSTRPGRRTSCPSPAPCRRCPCRTPGPGRRCSRCASSLEPGDSLGARVDGHVVRVSLPPGEQVRVAVSSTVARADLDALRPVALPPGQRGDDARRLHPRRARRLRGADAGGVAGWTWWLTPSVDVRLVHAVPVPVRAAASCGPCSVLAAPPGARRRGPQRAGRRPRPEHRHAAGPGQLDRAGRRRRPPRAAARCPRSDVVVRSVVGERERTGVLFLVDLQPTGGDAERLGGVGLHRALQTFEDTHHRRVTYVPSGTTRYAEYFDRAQVPEEPPAGEPVVLDIPSLGPARRPRGPGRRAAAALGRRAGARRAVRVALGPSLRRAGVARPALVLLRRRRAARRARLRPGGVGDRGGRAAPGASAKAQQARTGRRACGRPTRSSSAAAARARPTVPPLLTPSSCCSTWSRRGRRQRRGISARRWAGRSPAAGTAAGPAAPVTRWTRRRPCRCATCAAGRRSGCSATGRSSTRRRAAGSSTSRCRRRARCGRSSGSPSPAGSRSSIPGCELSAVALTGWVQPLPSRTLTVSRPDAGHVQVTLSGVVGLAALRPGVLAGPAGRPAHRRLPHR